LRRIVRRPASKRAPSPAPAPAAEAPPASGEWTEGEILLPRAKRLVSLRIDADVLDWFQSGGKGYQTRMNAVLRAWMESKKSRGR
jgi:uncharacterized protein (DUF4415 family)